MDFDSEPSFAEASVIFPIQGSSTNRLETRVRRGWNLAYLLSVFLFESISNSKKGRNSMIRQFNVILAGTVLVVALTSLSCSKDSSNPGGGGSSSNPPNTVVMMNTAFSPSSLTVAMGTTVTWKNNDGFAHTSTSDTGVWETGNIAGGASTTTAFSNAGTFKYHCTIHGFAMSGTIVVQASSY